MLDVSLSPDVVIIDGVPRVSSLEIAERFCKQHNNVLTSIRKICLECEEDFNALNFKLVEYADAKGEMRPMYQLSRDGFTLLAMGFAGKKALEWKIMYIQAFNAMDEALKKKHEKQALKEAKKKALPSTKHVALPCKSYEEECREAVAELVSLRGEIFKTTSKISDVLRAPFWRDTVCTDFKQHMNKAIGSFFLSINTNIETMELLFKAYVEAEKLIRK